MELVKAMNGRDSRGIRSNETSQNNEKRDESGSEEELKEARPSVIEKKKLVVDLKNEMGDDNLEEVDL